MKPTISIVVAMNSDRVIGVDNNLPWHIPEDLRHFKKCTLNKPIIMGRKTFESIGRILPQRKNIIISNTLNISSVNNILKSAGFLNEIYIRENVEIYKSLSSAIADNMQFEEICIIGGAEIFKLALNIVDKIYLTLVDIELLNLILTPVAVVRFPQIDMQDWKIVKNDTIVTSCGVRCHFQDLVRIK